MAGDDGHRWARDFGPELSALARCFHDLSISQNGTPESGSKADPPAFPKRNLNPESTSSWVQCHLSLGSLLENRSQIDFPKWEHPDGKTGISGMQFGATNKCFPTSARTRSRMLVNAHAFWRRSDRAICHLPPGRFCQKLSSFGNVRVLRKPDIPETRKAAGFPTNRRLPCKSR